MSTFRQCLELLRAISLCGPPAGMTATKPLSSACKPVAFSVPETGRRTSAGAQLAHRLNISTTAAKPLRIASIAYLRSHAACTLLFLRRVRLIHALSGVQVPLQCLVRVNAEKREPLDTMLRSGDDKDQQSKRCTEDLWRSN